MAHHFHPLRVKKLKKETPDCVSIVFDVPEDLQSLFHYKEGQNLTIKKNINGEEARRSYSICNAPFENELRIAVKKIDGGLFSTFANDELKENDTLEIMPPSGKFNAHLSTETNNNYLAIAAGSGITPILSIIKHTLHEQTDSHFTLVYGSKNRSAIIFFEELENLKNKFINRFTFINILSRERMDAEVLYGRIDKNKLQALDKIIDYKKIRAAYLCGPESMIFESADFLQQQGINKSNIHFELFITPGQATQQKQVSVTDSLPTGPKSKITLKLDGRAFDFELEQKGNSILDAALQNGADLPYACKGGVCCTCRAKVIEGTVKMDVNYALEEEEVAQGFILTCQSHPTSENVVIDFDIK